MDQRRFHRHRPGKRPGRHGAVRCPADRRRRVLETAARRPVGLRSPARGDRPHRLRRPGPSGRGDRHPRLGRRPVLHLDRGVAAAGAGHLAGGCESPRRRRQTDPAPADAHRRGSTPDPARTRRSGRLRLRRARTREDHRRDHGQSPTESVDRSAGPVRTNPGRHRDRLRPELPGPRRPTDPGQGRPRRRPGRHHPRLQDGTALRHPHAPGPG